MVWQAMVDTQANVTLLAHTPWKRTMAHEGAWRTEWRLVRGDPTLRIAMMQDDAMRRYLGWQGCAIVQYRRVDCSPDYSAPHAQQWHTVAVSGNPWHACRDVGDTAYEQADSQHPIHSQVVRLIVQANDLKRQLRTIEVAMQNLRQSIPDRGDRDIQLRVQAKLTSRRLWAAYKRREIDPAILQTTRKECLTEQSIEQAGVACALRKLDEQAAAIKEAIRDVYAQDVDWTSFFNDCR